MKKLLTICLVSLTLFLGVASASATTTAAASEKTSAYTEKTISVQSDPGGIGFTPNKVDPGGGGF